VFGAVADGDDEDGAFAFGVGREEAGHVVQRMSSFFSRWAKSLSLVARKAFASGGEGFMAAATR